MADALAGYPYIACLDLSSFDSAQRGLIWELENALFETIVPEWAEVWRSIAHNVNWIKGKSVQSIQTCCRNSGEMTTSLSNTAISYWLIKFACYKNGIRLFRDVMIKVEGDDNISGW